MKETQETAVLPAVSAAQSQSGGGSGVPSVAIPKTTEVLVILTPRQVSLSEFFCNINQNPQCKQAGTWQDIE